MEELENILRSNRMSTRPEFYSGRGATLTDLDGQILEGIYQGINLEFGEKAAKGFVSMVSGIKVISATCFLQELYKLFYSNWEYSSDKDELGIAVGKNEDGEFDLASGMMGIADSIFSDCRDDTQSIKNWFLMGHGVQPKEMYDNQGFTVYYRY